MKEELTKQMKRKTLKEIYKILYKIQDIQKHPDIIESANMLSDLEFDIQNWLTVLESKPKKKKSKGTVSVTVHPEELISNGIVTFDEKGVHFTNTNIIEKLKEENEMLKKVFRKPTSCSTSFIEDIVELIYRIPTAKYNELLKIMNIYPPFR